MRRIGAVLLVLVAGACGRGDGRGPGPVELFVVSGFPGVSGSSGSCEACYLKEKDDAGPYLVSALAKAGYAPRARYYGDSEADYARLVADLLAAGGPSRAASTRVVLVGHSHGGVWAHAATRAVPEAKVDVLVDLDTSSYGWVIRATLGNAKSIGDPRGACVLEKGGRCYDLEDVVFPNVAADLEVRSGEHAVFGLMPEAYDDQENVAMSKSSTVETWNVHTSHSEVHDARGTTMPRVAAWVVARLGKS